MRPHKQTELYDFIYNWKKAHPHEMGPIVVNSHRRLGKTRLGIILANERCLAQPDQEVRLIAPTIDMCETIVRPQLDQILRDCPEYLMPVKRYNTYVYHNPMWNKPGAYSTLYLEGSEHKKGNRSRGKGSDMVVLDEFRDMEDPNTLIDDILAYHFVGKQNPLLLIISTPPDTMDHPMVKRFIPEAQHNDCYMRVQAPDNLDFTKEDKEMLLKICKSVSSISYRREALCELISDPKDLVIPEFVEHENNKTLDDIVVSVYPRPDFYYPRVCVDTGYDDWNGAVYYYVDWQKQLLVVEGEMWAHRQTTRSLKEMLVSKANEIFPKPPHDIIYEGDLTKQMQADMAEMLKFNVIPVDKTDKAVQIMALRDSMRNKKIRIVGPKCPILCYQLRNGTYGKNPKNFIRSIDDEELGHCDLLAALIYAHRRANWSTNPFPREGMNLWGNFIPTGEDDEMDNLEVIDVQEYHLN